jgi:heat shock protein HspQ
MSNLLILKNSDSKIPYVNRGGTKYFIDYTNEVLRLTNEYINRVYSYSQSIIGAGVKQWDINGLAVGITFDINGEIDNTSDWYDYTAAKEYVKSIFETLINNDEYSSTYTYMSRELGCQLSYVDDGLTQEYRITKLFNIVNKGDNVQLTALYMPYFREKGIGMLQFGTNAVMRLRNSNKSYDSHTIFENRVTATFLAWVVDTPIFMNGALTSARHHLYRRLVTNAFRYYYNDSPTIITSTGAIVENIEHIYTTIANSTTGFLKIMRGATTIYNQNISIIYPVGGIFDIGTNRAMNGYFKTFHTLCYS